MSDSKLYGQGSISGRDRDYSIHRIKRMALRPAKSPLLFYVMVTSGSFPGNSQLGYRTDLSSHTSCQARELHGAVLRYTCNFTFYFHNKYTYIVFHIYSLPPGTSLTSPAPVAPSSLSESEFSPFFSPATISAIISNSASNGSVGIFS